MGNASRRRIKSNSARSLSLRNAARIRLRPGLLRTLLSRPLFMHRLLEYLQICFIPLPSRSLLAGDYILQARKPDLASADFDVLSARAQAVEGFNPVNTRHEVDLQAPVFVHHAV